MINRVKYNFIFWNNLTQNNPEFLSSGSASRVALSSWSEWASCSAGCEQTGVQTRSRACPTAQLPDWRQHCPGPLQEGRMCQGQPCTGTCINHTAHVPGSTAGVAIISKFPQSSCESKGWCSNPDFTWLLNSNDPFLHEEWNQRWIFSQASLPPHVVTPLCDTQQYLLH